ncbi:hypothetical protein MMC29_004579 [Sticta canariensis]|nr:hypothetical protein [Sticta canariensis]
MAPALIHDPMDHDFLHVPVGATHESNQHKNNQHEIPVLLPDMFVSFLSRKPQLNPHYESIRAESEAWISETCHLSPEASKRIAKADWSYFAAVMAKEAGSDEYRTACDWGNWVLPFDDMFDESSLKEDPEKAYLEVQNLLAAMQTTDPENELPQCSPLVEAHNSVWFRIAKKASRGARERFVHAMVDFCNGVVDEIKFRSQNIKLDPETFKKTRRKTIGVAPVLAMIEYFYNLDLPDEVFEHKSMIEITRVAVDFVIIHNDLVSYSKEEREDGDYNLVMLYRLGGMEPQEAFDQMGELLKALFRDWYLALAELPQWGEAIDSQVQKYIEGVQDMLLANVNWR